jgi:hypothetical protein
MTSDFQGATITCAETSFLVQNLYIPPATAQIGGVSFPASLVVADADWDFLATALDGPPKANPLLGELLSQPSILER